MTLSDECGGGCTGLLRGPRGCRRRPKETHWVPPDPGHSVWPRRREWSSVHEGRRRKRLLSGGPFESGRGNRGEKKGEESEDESKR